MTYVVRWRTTTPPVSGCALPVRSGGDVGLLRTYFRDFYSAARDGDVCICSAVQKAVNTAFTCVHIRVPQRVK